MKIKADVEITPKLMAEQFWNWEDSQQCKFFEELAKVITEDYRTNTSAYSYGELQWYYLGKTLNENPLAKEVACAMLAPVFLHSTNFMENK